MEQGKKYSEEIKKTIMNLLDIAGFGYEEVELKEKKGEEMKAIYCNIKTTNDSNFLIGQYGVNLNSFQHILRLLIRKIIPEKVKFTLDINSYKQEKEDNIIEKARLAAQQAIQDKKVVILQPMNAYERRIVHLELSKNEKVITESLGEGEDRKVAVRPVENIINA